MKCFHKKLNSTVNAAVISIIRYDCTKEAAIYVVLPVERQTIAINRSQFRPFDSRSGTAGTTSL